MKTNQLFIIHILLNQKAMKKLIFLIVTILSLPLFINAQTTAGKGYIEGRIKDMNNEIIEYASATLMNTKEEFVQGTVSNENGFFRFENIAIQSYIIDFQFLGFKKERITVDLTKKDKKDFTRWLCDRCIGSSTFSDCYTDWSCDFKRK